MEISKLTAIELTAAEGCVITQKISVLPENRVFGKSVCITSDDVDKWHEITEEEAAPLREESEKAQKEAMNKQPIAFDESQAETEDAPTQ